MAIEYKDLPAPLPKLVEEVPALLDWAVNQPPSHVGDLQDLEQAWSDFGKQLETVQPSDVDPTALLKAYHAVIEKTFPVTGRTLYDTKIYTRQTGAVGFYTLFIFSVVLLSEIQGSIYHSAKAAPDGTGDFSLFIYKYFTSYLNPFLWGALGSCVYLLMKISEKVSTNVFEAARLQGWKARILLGAVIGGIVVNIYKPESFGMGNVPLSIDALAFFSGIGVKVVYGAFQMVIQSISDKLGLDSVRTSTRQDTVDFLSSRLQKIDPVKDPKAHETVVSLLAKAQENSKS